MSIFTSKKLKSPAINLKDDEKQNTITQHADQANYNTIITQENLQTGSYLNSQREFLIKDKQHTQNILSQKKDSQVNNQGIYFQEQNSNQNNDYENIYLTNKEDQQKQILKSNDIFEKRSSRFDINIHSDQIEIIDGNDNSVVSPQTTQRKYQKTENEIIDIDEQGQKENLNNQIVNNNDKYHKEKAAQIGLVYKAQLKNDDSPSQIKRKSDQKSEKSILSNQQSLKNYANNGQKLWSIVKKDIFYPIKFNGKLAFGLSNQPYQIIDILIDFVFLIDMFFSCITGINEGGEIIKDRYYITKKYLRVSSLILICVHVMTCWWIEIGQLEQLGETADLPQEFKQVGWVNNYYLKYPNKPQYGSYNQDIYITGYYFVTTTIATVGYGDLASKTVMEEFYTMFCEFFGIALFGYISGGLISAVQISLLVGTQKRNEMKSEFDQWLFQREKNRETPLYFQLLKNLRDINNFNTEKNFSNFFNHQEYFHYLPKEQKRKIFNLIFTDIATFFGAFFRNINELSMIQDLFQYMHPLSFLPGAEIIKYRSLPRGLYLLVSGKVHIGTGKKINSMLVNNNLKAGQKNKNKVKHIERQYFRKLYPGSFFGEFSLLEKNSSFNFVAGGKQIVNVLYISKAKFIETCSKYKESNQWLKQFSYYRFKYFKMVIQFFTKYDLKSIKIIQKEKYAYLKKVNFQMKNNQKRPNQNEKAGFSRFSKLKQIFNNKKEELENNFVEDEVNNEDSESDDQEKYIYSQRDTTKKIEPINESKELDFSSSSDISSKENQKIIKETFEQSEQNQQTDKASSKQNILHAKKQSLLDEMQLKEDEPLPRISQVFNPQDHKRGVKSDLSLYLQNSKKGEGQNIHKRVFSQPINLINFKFVQKDTLKQKQQNIIPNAVVQQVRHARVKSLEQQDKKQREKHIKYKSLNIREKAQSISKNKKSFNFQFNQMDEFKEKKVINNPTDQQLQVQINESEDNANQPYQFNIHFRDPNFNALSPHSKENDKLISTPFSSNQQTQTRDTTNNQKLLFSDDDQNSVKGRQGENKDFQINEINLDQIQRAFEDQKSQQTEQYHSCIIGIDSDQEEDFYKDLQMDDQFNSKNKESYEVYQEFQLKKDFNTQNQLEKIENQKLNQIDFSKFQINQNKNQQLVQLNLQKSQDINSQIKQNQIIQKAEKNQHDDILSKIQFNEVLNDQKTANCIEKVDGISQQNQIYVIQETNEEHLNDNNKQVEDLILFDSSDNLSFFLDEEEEENENTKNNQNNGDQDILQQEENKDQNNNNDDCMITIKNLNKADEIIENSNKDESLQSQDAVEDIMNSSEEKDLDQKVKAKKIENIRNDSVHHLKLINEEEKKIRRAFRYQTTSNNQLEMLQTKKQVQIAEKVGVKIPYINQLSSSRFKMLAQNKVMKKILNKKISILVNTVMQKSASSNSSKKAFGNHTLRSLNKNSVRYISQHENELDNQNGLDSQQFKDIMVSTPNSSTSQQDKPPSKFFTFKEVVSQRSSPHNNYEPQIDFKRCYSQSMNNSPSNKNILSNDNRQKINSSPRILSSYRHVPSPKHNENQDYQKIQNAPKSKFSQNVESKSPIQLAQSELFNQQNDKEILDSQEYCEKIQQISCSEVPNILIQDAVVEDDIQNIDEDSDVKDDQSDDIEIQMNQIYNSRVPNFQLMLYIDKIVNEHKKKYLQGSEFFDTDDYQCYDEIENNEKLQDLGNSNKEQSALDNSIDIPIEIIKPNFDIQELHTLPSYLSSQISIMENKIQQIIETTFDDCYVCIEKIKKLNSIKQKKKLSIRQFDESEAIQSSDLVSNVGIKGASESSCIQKITISNIINESQQPQRKTFNNLNQQSLNVNIDDKPIQKNNEKGKQTPKKINLGYNLQFSMQDEKNQDNKDDFNFFTELEKKNQILQNFNQDQEGQLTARKIFGLTPQKYKSKIEYDKPQDMQAEDNQKGFSDAVEKAQSNITKNSKEQDQQQLQSGNLKQSYLKVFSKEYNNSNNTEQDKIKNEFKKMFHNIFSQGDKSPISMEMSHTSN